MMSNIHLATHLLSETKLYSQWKNIGPLPASSRKTLNILPKGGICQDLRKHEGAVPARVNEAFALIDGGDHSATWTWPGPDLDLTWTWPGRWMITSIYKSEGLLHARGNSPFMLSYILSNSPLRKNIEGLPAWSRKGLNILPLT